MQHRGEILKKVIQESDYPITKLARRIKRSRQFIYNLYSNPSVNPDIIVAIGKVLDHDFSNEIDFFQIAEEPLPHYTNKKSDGEEYWKGKYELLLKELEKKKDEISLLKDKYVSLLEEHQNLLKTH